VHKFNNRRAITKKTNSMAKLFYCQPELVEGGLQQRFQKLIAQHFKSISKFAFTFLISFGSFLNAK